MIEKMYYESPLGDILLAADEEGLTGLWLPEQHEADEEVTTMLDEDTNPHLVKAALWLDSYFAGHNPDPKQLKLNAKGTEFQKQVWDRLIEIPYGEVRSYGQIAAEVAEIRGIEKMSSRAVGSANGRNPISIIVPCHRVIGSNSKLTGYGGGIHLKKWLLEHEGLEIKGEKVCSEK